MGMSDRKEEGWIGVDLDGTLADDSGTISGTIIGPPIPLMEHKVRAWIAGGQRVKIMTARASVPEMIPVVREWLIAHNFVYADGEPLEITNEKDFLMLEQWDDRAVQVIRNTGKTAVEFHIEVYGNG